MIRQLDAHTAGSDELSCFQAYGELIFAPIWGCSRREDAVKDVLPLQVASSAINLCHGSPSSSTSAR